MSLVTSKTIVEITFLKTKFVQDIKPIGKTLTNVTGQKYVKWLTL